MWRPPPLSATLREGLAAGVVGQLAALVWGTAVDLVTARALALPHVLGGAILRQVVGAGASPAAGVVTFAALAFGISLAVGCAAALVLHAAQRRPGVLVAGAFAFLLLQFVLCVTTLILAGMGGGIRVWFHLTGSDVVQSVAIGVFLVRRHPELRALLAHGDDDGPPLEPPSAARPAPGRSP